jgi:short subunit dehydrogenase-like uncharacterized protein
MADRRGGASVVAIPGSYPTFYAVFDRIAPAANKYMATLFNTSTTRKVVVTHVWRFNWQVAAVTGILLEQYLARITARTAGTGVTIFADDTADTLSAGISADTNSTAVTENHIIVRSYASSEEMALAATGIVLGTAVDDAGEVLYQRRDGQRGLTLRQNQGLSVRNVTSSAIGTVSYIIEFFDILA